MTKRVMEYVSVPQEQLTTPPANSGFYEVFINYWWAHDIDNNILFGRAFGIMHPLANRNEKIAATVGNYCDRYAGVVQLPVVYRNHDCRDYND